MRICLLAASFLVGIISSARAQFVISPSTQFAISGSTKMVIESIGDVTLKSPMDLGKAELGIHLLGSGDLFTSRQDSVTFIQLNSTTGNYAVKGKWIVRKGIDFIQGNLVVPSISTSTTDQLIYIGENDLGKNSSGAPSGTSFVQGPIFILGNNASSTFPIGNSTGFFPVRLEKINASTLLSAECKLGDPTIPAASLPVDIDNVFKQWYWELGVQNGTFSGSAIQLSLDNTDTFVGNEKAVVIEREASTQNITDLEGTINNTNNSVVSGKNTSGLGGVYALATSKKVDIRIHRIITPNGDGANETLFIEGINFYPDNKVTLIDRYGAMYFEKSNFTNYSSNVAQQADFDYSKLNSGNYICTVEYTGLNGKTQKAKPQMITVLK